MSSTPPLYEQLQRKPYPEHQQIDKASLRWLYEQLRPNAIDINSLIRGYRPYPELGYETINNIAPTGIMHGIHGYGHGLRVSIYCWLILQYLEIENHFSDRQTTELILAALFHDVGRVNDNADSDHGKRSAEWIRKSFAKKVSAETLAAVANHSIDKRENASLVLAILQSADAMDRYRLPKASWWPDYSRIALEVGGLDAFCRFITYSVEKIILECTDSKVAKTKVRSWLQQQGI